MPCIHQVKEALPAVSGSSGKLKILNSKTNKKQREWPGQVFDDRDLSYEEAMNRYVSARNILEETNQEKKDHLEETNQKMTQKENEQKDVRETKKQIQEQEQILRKQRRILRQQRKLENSARKNLVNERRAEIAIYQMLPKREKIAKQVKREANERLWSEKKRARKLQLENRKTQDQAWRAERDLLRQRKSKLSILTTWIAILVIVDNCTRQCLGVPMFIAGANVTAEMVTNAFAALLPRDLQYLITDRGIHFRAKVSEALAEKREFSHVLLAPHRPQSNGVAERFVKTLKEYLSAYSWQNPYELNSLLFSFIDFYNNRPHQGKELKGLSPDEYAHRLLVVS